MLHDVASKHSIFVEVPEDSPRLHSPSQRRLAVLLARETLCVVDPRSGSDRVAESELDAMISRGFARILDRPVVEDAARVAAEHLKTPPSEVRTRFRHLIHSEGRTTVQGPALNQAGMVSSSIVMPKHDHLPSSDWLPTELFLFERPASPAALAALAGDPRGVLNVVADGIHETLAAGLATLEVISDEAGGDLVSSALVAPVLRALELSHRTNGSLVDYISDAPTLLARAVLRHCNAVEHLDSIPIEQAMDIAEECSEAHAAFHSRLRQVIDSVIESEDPNATAERLIRGKLVPEVEAFDREFGTTLAKLKTYSKAAIGNTASLVSLPLVGLGVYAGLSTLWALTLGAVSSATQGSARTFSARDRFKKSWPRLLLAIRETQR